MHRLADPCIVRTALYAGFIETRRSAEYMYKRLVLSVTSMYCVKTADSIEMPFTVVGAIGPRNNVLKKRAHWRHLANTIERLCAAVTIGLHQGWRRDLLPNYFGQFHCNGDDYQ